MTAASAEEPLAAPFTASPPFPLPRPVLPAWLLAAQVRPTPEQIARLDEALAAVDDQGRRGRVRPIFSRNCRARS